MSTRTIETALRTIEELGGKPPPATFEALAELADLRAKAHEFSSHLRPDVGRMIVAALDAGRDPLDDPDVQQAATRLVLADNAPRYIAGIINTREALLVDEHAPLVLAAFTLPFDKAARTITNALPVLGDVDLAADTLAITRQGGDAGRVWAEIHQAEQTIAKILTTWKKLCVAKTVGPWMTRHELLAIADIPPAGYIAENLERRHTMRPWDIARRGWPLTIATPHEWHARIHAVRDERDRQRTGARPTAAAR